MVRPSAMTAQVAGSFSGIAAKSIVRAFRARRYAIRRHAALLLYLLYLLYFLNLFLNVVQRQRHRGESALPPANPS